MPVLATLFMAGFSGCDVLHDDLSDCELTLQFRYDYTMEGKDLFTEQVQEVKVFIFDDNGKFLREFIESGEPLKATGYRMRIPYRYKNRTMVVWAGKTEEPYRLAVMETGDPIEKLTLRFEPDGGTYNRHLATIWHSGPAQMVFPNEGGTAQTVGLVRNTNDIKVSLTRKGETLGAGDFDIRMEGANGAYEYNNHISGQRENIAYTPCKECGAAAPASHAQLHTLRLTEGVPMKLTVTEKSTGRKIDIGGSEAVNLVEYLLKSRPEGMGRQEYLDRRYDWDVSLRLGDNAQNGYIALSITINGWTYWFHPTDLH
jgi:hypothetical protein